MTDNTKKTGIAEAAALAGGQVRLAEMLGVTQQNVSRWIQAGFTPTRWVVPVEQATGVPRERLIDPKLVDLVKPRIFD